MGWYIGFLIVVISLTFLLDADLPRPDQDPEWEDEQLRKLGMDGNTRR